MKEKRSIKKGNLKHKMTNELIKICKSKTYQGMLNEFQYHGECDVNEYKERYGDNGKIRCLCHGVLKTKFVTILNKKSGIPAVVGKKCAEQFGFGDIEPTIEELRALKKKFKLLKKNIVDFKILKNIDLAYASMMISLKLSEEEQLTKKVMEKINYPKLYFSKHKGESVRNVVEKDKKLIKFILSDKFDMRKVEHLHPDYYMFASDDESSEGED